MADITVPTAPALATLPDVELMHTGTWQISTGEFNVTVEDLSAAVAALECPAVRRPVLKLGHTDPRFDGEPAVGWVANMATAENGRALVGDYTGMPGWLGDVIASAYPDRSIEGQYDFRCQLGHTHPFVLTGVALLGVAAPGIGTLESLQDVATLYGVAASAGASGTPVSFTIHASAQEVAVPNPRPLQINAAVTSEDVRRAYYDGPGDSWDQWIESMELDPLQLIVMDDKEGKRYRIPVTIGDGDGEDAVSFGDPVSVVIRYEDAPKASAGAVVTWASKAESRPGSKPDKPSAEPAKQAPVSAADAARKIHQAPIRGSERKEATVDFTDAQLAALRTTLGLSDDQELEPAAVLAAIGDKTKSGSQDAKNDPADEPEDKAPVAAKKAAGTITIDASAWDEREERIKRLEASAAKRAREERDQVISAAVQDGKFAPARKEHWARLWDADPEGTREVLAGLHKNIVPVEALGSGADDGDDLDAEFAGLFRPTTNGA